MKAARSSTRCLRYYFFERFEVTSAPYIWHYYTTSSRFRTKAGIGDMMPSLVKCQCWSCFRRGVRNRFLNVACSHNVSSLALRPIRKLPCCWLCCAIRPGSRYRLFQCQFPIYASSECGIFTCCNARIIFSVKLTSLELSHLKLA